MNNNHAMINNLLMRAMPFTQEQFTGFNNNSNDSNNNSNGNSNSDDNHDNNNSNDNSTNENAAVIADVPAETQRAMLSSLWRMKGCLLFALLLIAKIISEKIIQSFFLISAILISSRAANNFSTKLLGPNSPQKMISLAVLLLILITLSMYIILGFVYYDAKTSKSSGTLSDRLMLKDCTGEENKGFLDTIWIILMADLFIHLWFFQLKVLTSMSFLCFYSNTRFRRLKKIANFNFIWRQLPPYLNFNSNNTSNGSNRRGNNSNNNSIDIEVGDMGGSNISGNFDHSNVDYDLKSTSSDEEDNDGEGGSSNESRRTAMIQILQKKIFLVLALISLIYRTLLPSPMWTFYFKSSPFISLLYMSFKLPDLSIKIFALHQGISNLILGRQEFGIPSTIEELRSLDSCSICFENPTHPITLTCKHVFCESCICEWVEREPTCPICRVRIQSSSSILQQLRDGQIDQFVLF